MSLSWSTTWPLTSMIHGMLNLSYSSHFLHGCVNTDTEVTSHWLLWLKRFSSLLQHTLTHFTHSRSSYRGHGFKNLKGWDRTCTDFSYGCRMLWRRPARTAKVFVSLEALVKAVSVQDPGLNYSRCCRSSDWAVNKLQQCVNSWWFLHGVPAWLKLQEVKESENCKLMEVIFSSLLPSTQCSRYYSVNRLTN